MSTGAFTWTPTTTGSFTFKVRVTDNTGLFDEEQITVTVTATFAMTGINDESIKVVSPEATIYPNPVAGSLTIVFNTYINKLNATITDVKGSSVIQSELNINGKSDVKMDVSKLKPGTYFLRIQTKSGVQNLKFIKL